MAMNFAIPISKTIPLTIIILWSFSKLVISSLEDDSSYTAMRPNNATKIMINPVVYHNNVDQLLSDLTSSSSDSSTTPLPGFFNTTVGQPPEKVYGSYLCRGDLTLHHCYDCVSNVTSDLTIRFSSNKDFYQDWFGFNDRCMIHFANHSIFNIYEKDYLFTLGPDSSPKESNFKEYNQTLSSTIDGLVKEAAIGNWTRPNFAMRVVDVMGSNGDEKIYALVQCTPDLAAVNCSRCLGDLHSRIPICCNGTPGGMIIHASCMIMYDNESFFDSNGGCPIFVLRYLHVYFVVLLSMYLLF